MNEPMCTCHCGGTMFYRHLHAENCLLSQVGEEAPKSELQHTREENAALRARLVEMELERDAWKSSMETLEQTHKALIDQIPSDWFDYDPVMSVVLERHQIQEKIGREQIAALSSQLADAHAEIARLKGD